MLWHGFSWRGSCSAQRIERKLIEGGIEFPPLKTLGTRPGALSLDRLTRSGPWWSTYGPRHSWPAPAWPCPAGRGPWRCWGRCLAHSGGPGKPSWTTEIWCSRAPGSGWVSEGAFVACRFKQNMQYAVRSLPSTWEIVSRNRSMVYAKHALCSLISTFNARDFFMKQEHWGKNLETFTLIIS